MRAAAVVLLLACREEPLATPSPLPTAPTPPPEVLVRIESAPGVRDLRAVSDAPVAAWSWREDDALTELDGDTVPAHRVWPGATWTVEVELDDGRRGEASLTVPPPPGGNALVLLLDDAGVDKIGAYGGPYAAPTPRIDALADVGVRFTRAYASPVCSPTRGTLLTGRHPRRTGVGWILDTGTRDHELPIAATTIPEALWEARGAESWSNGAIGKWHLAGPNAPDWLTHPMRSGFDWFVGAPGNPQYAEGTGYWSWNRNDNGVLLPSTVYMTTATVDDALARIAQMPEPWFLYVSFNAPHTPLNPPPAALISGPVPTEDDPQHVRYDAMLEAADTEIGRLLDALDPALLARTTVILLGDNGTSAHGTPDPYDLDRQKHTPYERGVRVPLIVAGPHVARPGSVSGALVHAADLLPTLADLAGVPLGGPEGERLELADGPIALDGRSLLPFLADPDAPGRGWVYAEAHSNGPGPTYGIDRRALRDLTHKLVSRQGALELYRLEGPDELDVTDLLASGAPLDADDDDAYTRLLEVYDALDAELVYEGR